MKWFIPRSKKLDFFSLSVQKIHFLYNQIFKKIDRFDLIIQQIQLEIKNDIIIKMGDNKKETIKRE